MEKGRSFSTPAAAAEKSAILKMAADEYAVQLGFSEDDDVLEDCYQRETFFIDSSCVLVTIAAALELDEAATHAAMHHLTQCAIAVSLQHVRSPPAKRCRKVYDRVDYKQCGWWKMLGRATSADPLHRDGKLFRRRFRVPFPMFGKLLLLVKAWFPEKRSTDVAGNPRVPKELLLLGVLRVLGRGVCFDEVAEATGMSEETMRRFFHAFCREFAVRMYETHVHPPQTPAEIAADMDVYARLGFPGAIGSTDCTHVRWDMVPASQRNLFVGKEGFPTAAFEITVNFSRKIFAVTSSHPGSRNDKTIVKYDAFVCNIRDKRLFADVTYELLKDNSETGKTTERGAYLLTDNGYHLWRCLQCPIKHAFDDDEVQWSHRLESVRKDVECAFGILKGRWRFLKLPILLHTQSYIDNIFFTCAILHNMLLESDAATLAWEADVDWAGVDGLHEQAGAEDRMDDAAANAPVRVGRMEVLPTDDFSFVGGDSIAPEGVEVEANHDGLRAKLVRHFAVQAKNNALQWPKTRRSMTV